MIPEPCKYTPDVSFVNVTFFNISAFVNSWKRCQPCFNGAQKRTAFKEMAHHCNSQNYKRCQKATFSRYWLAPGNAALRHCTLVRACLSWCFPARGYTGRDVELPGVPWGRRRAEPWRARCAPAWPPWMARGGAGRGAGAAAPTVVVTTYCHEATAGMRPPSQGRGGSRAYLSHQHWCCWRMRYVFVRLRLLLLGPSSLQR